MKLYLKVEGDDLKLTDKSKQVIEKGLNYTAQSFIANLQANSPVDTGLLRQWAVTQNSEFIREIRSPASYAVYVNDGTGIYGPSHQKITSKTPGKPLVFEYKGETVFAMSVKGQKGQKFVEKSINQTSDLIEGFFVRAANEVDL